MQYGWKMQIRKNICDASAFRTWLLAAASIYAGGAAHAAEMAVEANSQYFSKWTFIELRAPGWVEGGPGVDFYSKDPQAGSAIWNGESIAWQFDGTINGVADGEPGVATRGWEAIGNNLPARIGAPRRIGSAYIDRGVLSFSSSKPFWSNSTLFFYDVDWGENFDIKFFDCSGTAIDAGNFDFLKISTINTPNHTIKGTAPARYWNITYPNDDAATVNGIVMRSNQVCKVEITMARPAPGGGTNFFLGSPPNSAPAATSRLGGKFNVGAVVVGSYNYSDPESDAENTTGSGTQYKFVTSQNSSIASSAQGSIVASGASGGEGSTVAYTLQPSDANKYLFYCVSPVALSGAISGLETCSAAPGPVGSGPILPTPGTPKPVPSLSVSSLLGLAAAILALYSFCRCRPGRKQSSASRI